MNGRAAVARRGTKWTGKTTGKPIGNSNRMDGITEAEKKMKPIDRREREKKPRQ